MRVATHRLDQRQSVYLLLLYSYLRQYNVEPCEYLTMSRLPLLLLNAWRIRLYHFHWIEYQYAALATSSKGMNRLLRKLTLVVGAIGFVSVLIILRLLPRRSTIVTLHNLSPHEILWEELEKAIFRICLSLFNIVIVHNYFSRREARRLYGIGSSKIRIIPHGNFIGIYGPLLSKQEARLRLGIGKGQFVIAYVGGTRRDKRVDALLEAMEAIMEEFSSVHFVAGGECSDKITQARLLTFGQSWGSRSTIIPRYLTNSEVSLILSAADAGVIPYQTTTTPGSLILFCSYSRPCVVPDLPSIRELVGDDSCIFYRAGDDTDLESAIRKMIQRRDVVEKMGKSARAKVERYNWDDIAKKTLDVYQAALDRRAQLPVNEPTIERLLK